MNRLVPVVLLVFALGGPPPTTAAEPPYPPSPVIVGIKWAPAETIVRRARGGDNWPLTWADDDALYTAYGDGRGFEPFVDRKLSTGLAKVTGPADDFHGENLRSPTFEQTGDGSKGKKASGLLMVDGVLWAWLRNAGNSQLGSSLDHGRTWTWMDWKFTTSFGCPTFLNFGRNYAGARDRFVYVSSHDQDSAYKPADRMVLARVPQDRLADREAYEFFVRLDERNEPVWTPAIDQRGAVFTHAGRCYRSGITYNSGLKRYLWCQILPGGQPRFQGGFGVYDAPEPWGPWTTVYFTETWDVGPGETSSFPTKWIEDDGRTLHLVFSGDDCFSVRRATLKLRSENRGAATPRLYPGKEWQRATPEDVGLDSSELRKAREYALKGGGSGCVVRHGKLVLSWGDPQTRYDLKSTTKSIGVTALGLALHDGKVKLSDKARSLHPQFGTPPQSNTETGWLEEVTLEQLATQTAGFEKPGGYGKLLFRPGTKWHYSDAGPNWLAECLTLAYRRDTHELLFERVFTPIGITEDDLRWRKNSYRPHEIDGIPRREFGSGISANVDAMARIGYLYLCEGRWKDQQILPKSFVEAVRQTPKPLRGLPEHDPSGSHANASEHYGLLWWNNSDGTLPDVPRDAYWSWGLYDSLIVVMPSLDLVAARAGRSWPRKSDAHYDVLRPFLEPLTRSVKDPSEPDKSEPRP